MIETLRDQDVECSALGADMAAAIHDLHQKCFPAAWSRQAIEDALQTSGHHIIGIRDMQARAGALLGFVMIRLVLDEAEILTLAVDPACRRRGAARRLLRNMQLFLRQACVKQVFLEVRESNHAALALYQNEGFLPFGRRKNYYPPQAGENEPAPGENGPKHGKAEDALLLKKQL